MQKFCTNCGTSLEVGKEYCTACGAKILHFPSQSPTPAPDVKGRMTAAATPSATSVVVPEVKRSSSSLRLSIAVVVVAVGLAALCLFLIKGRSVRSVLIDGTSGDVVGDWSVSDSDLVRGVGHVKLKVVSVDSGGALHGELDLQDGVGPIPITGVATGNHISLEAPMFPKGYSAVRIQIKGTVSGDALSAEYALIKFGESEPSFSRPITMRRSSAVAGDSTANGANAQSQSTTQDSSQSNPPSVSPPSNSAAQPSPGPNDAASAGMPRIAQAIVQPGGTSLQLSQGRFYIYGMATGGAAPSTKFSSGEAKDATDAAGMLAAALAYGTENMNSYTTDTGAHDIGGVSIVGSWDSYTAYFGSNTQPSPSTASVTFNVPANSLVVLVGLAAGQQDIHFQGIPSLEIDAPNRGSSPTGYVAIAHAYLSPGTYTASEQSSVLAGGQDPEHMADLIGVFVFSSKH